MLHDFELSKKRVRLWQRQGESYNHVLLKALLYAKFIGEFPSLEIEKDVGLRYKPDLVAQDTAGNFKFWGECGANTLRKTSWLLKHAGVERLVLAKISVNIEQLAKQLRAEIPIRYRAGSVLCVMNFVPNIAELTASKKIDKVLPAWFEEITI